MNLFCIVGKDPILYASLGLDKTVVCGSPFTDKGPQMAFLFSFLISQICQQQLYTRISYRMPTTCFRRVV